MSSTGLVFNWKEINGEKLMWEGFFLFSGNSCYVNASHELPELKI